jgi:hypothetical protein
MPAQHGIKHLDRMKPVDRLHGIGRLPAADVRTQVAAIAAGTGACWMLYQPKRHRRRRAISPQVHGATKQKVCYSDEKSATLNNLLFISARVCILVLSETHPARIHDKRVANIMPYALPSGSRSLYGLGFSSVDAGGGGPPLVSVEAAREGVEASLGSRYSGARLAMGVHRP